jgi:hypothetical protein
MIGMANQLLVKPEWENMGLFAASVKKEMPIDNKLRQAIFGEFVNEIGAPDDNPTHRTKEMIGLQMQMQEVFYEQLYGGYISRLDKIMKSNTHQLTPTQINMLNMLHSSLVNITHKLAIDDVDMVLQFLEIPFDKSKKDWCNRYSDFRLLNIS